MRIRAGKTNICEIVVYTFPILCAYTLCWPVSWAHNTVISCHGRLSKVINRTHDNSYYVNIANEYKPSIWANTYILRCSVDNSVHDVDYQAKNADKILDMSGQSGAGRGIGEATAGPVPSEGSVVSEVSGVFK